MMLLLVKNGIIVVSFTASLGGEELKTMGVKNQSIKLLYQAINMKEQTDVTHALTVPQNHSRTCEV